MFNHPYNLDLSRYSSLVNLKILSLELTFTNELNTKSDHFFYVQLSKNIGHGPVCIAFFKRYSQDVLTKQV